MEFTGERFIPDCGLEGEIELEHLQRYLSVQDVVAGKRVLDVASGAGYGSALLAEKAGHVCGVDIDSEAVVFAKKHYDAVNLQYLQGSIASLPFQGDSFDAVISFETIEHVDDDLHVQFLEEVLRVLTPDGFLIMSTPDKHIYSDLAGYKNEFHVREYYRQEFFDFLQRFFPNIVLLDQLLELSHLITDNQADCCSVLRQKLTSLSGKYIIAVCSLGELPEYRKLNSVIFDQERSYQKKVDRVVELQGEIVEKNGNIADAWKMIHDRDDIIEQMKGEIAQKNREFHQKEERLLRLDRQNVEHVAEIEGKDQAHQRLLQEREGVLAEVNEVSAALSHIHSTMAWKIIQRMYWLKSKLWPF